MLHDENELQIKNFLKNNKNFSLKNIEEDISKYIKKNIFTFNKYGITLKPDTLNTDGYFISILKKSA